ncbi:hypothetical protein ES703_15524 [subsurface metagenome]
MIVRSPNLTMVGVSYLYFGVINTLQPHSPFFLHSWIHCGQGQCGRSEKHGQTPPLLAMVLTLSNKLPLTLNSSRLFLWANFSRRWRIACSLMVRGLIFFRVTYFSYLRVCLPFFLASQEVSSWIVLQPSKQIFIPTQTRQYLLVCYLWFIITPNHLT